MKDLPEDRESPDDQAAPVLRAASKLATASDTSQSLPVLDAFHKFLENERRHARRQMAVVTGFFVTIVLVLLGGGAFLAAILVGQMGRDLHNFEVQLAQVRNETRNSIDNVDSLLGRFSRQTETIKSDLARSEALLSRTEENAGRQATLKMEEISALQAMLKSIEAENLSIRNDFEQLRKRMSPIPVPAQDATTPQSAGSPAGENSVASAPSSTIELAVNMPTNGETMIWRLPIWE